MVILIFNSISLEATLDKTPGRLGEQHKEQCIDYCFNPSERQ